MVFCWLNGKLSFAICDSKLSEINQLQFMINEEKKFEVVNHSIPDLQSTNLSWIDSWMKSVAVLVILYVHYKISANQVTEYLKVGQI